MNRWIVPLLTACLVVGTAYADNDKGKGKDKGHDPSNHGQVTSECNQRANDKNLKGQERKDYVEWCQSRGARYGYKDDDYKRKRGCYQSVFDKMLGGEKRQSYLDECLREADRKHEGSKSKDRKQD